jgi:GxxExxY protein
MDTYQQNPLVKEIINCAVEVHKELGPGLLESTYRKCLELVFAEHGLDFQSEFDLPVIYKGHHLDCHYRIDMMVENQVILELKSVETLLGIHTAQLLTYMKLAGIHQGLLMNFNAPRLVDGLKSYLM